MKNIRFLLLIALGCAAAWGLSGCAAEPEATDSGGLGEILLARAMAVFAVSPDSNGYADNLISAGELDSLLKGTTVTDPFLLDTRPRREWEEQGHIAGAVWLPFQELAKPENLALLPRERLIVCISSTGHTGVQAAAVLRWLGYRAVTLEHGMASWTPTPAGRLMRDDVEQGIKKNYPVVHEAAVAQTLPLPLELSPPPSDQLEVLRAAAADMLQDNVFEKEHPFNHIFADQLFELLEDPERRQGLYLLDIRPLESWTVVGAIAGTVHLDWRLLTGHCQLGGLPRDKLIVVIGETGQTAGQVTPILRMLGLDAVTLRSGMTAWTRTPDSEATLTAISSAAYPVVK